MGYDFCNTGSEVPVSFIISVRGVVPMEVSSCANWESYYFNNAVSFASMCCFSLWRVGLKMSSSTCSAIIHCVVILCIVGVSGFAQECGFFLSSISPRVGSRCPTYSPLLNVIYILVSFDSRILTDVFPLLLWMPFIVFILGSFPFVELWLLMKYVICL